MYDYYSAQYKPTVGVDLSSKILNIDGADFNVSFWDIVGADKAGSVAKVTFLLILVFNLFDIYQLLLFWVSYSSSTKRNNLFDLNLHALRY